MIDFEDIHDWFEEHINFLLVAIPASFILFIGVIAVFEYDAKEKKEIEVTESKSGELVILEGGDKELMLERFEESYAEDYNFLSCGKGESDYVFVLSRREEN